MTSYRLWLQSGSKAVKTSAWITKVETAETKAGRKRVCLGVASVAIFIRLDLGQKCARHAIQNLVPRVHVTLAQRTFRIVWTAHVRPLEQEIRNRIYFHGAIRFSSDKLYRRLYFFKRAFCIIINHFPSKGSDISFKIALQPLQPTPLPYKIVTNFSCNLDLSSKKQHIQT